VQIPGAAGQILAILQVALQTALLVAVSTETVASASGIGRFISDSLNTMLLTHLWVVVIVMGVVGFLLNELFESLAKLARPWERSYREGVLG
jgi:ABC-type nitrate/sulfonate/bicarbonate transport system permease component